MSEQPVSTGQAQVFTYSGGWKPKSNGWSALTLYKNASANSYRIIGMDGQTVTVNSSLYKGMAYTKSSATFYTWQDSQATFGVNFGDAGSAGQFANAVNQAVQALSAPPKPAAPVAPSAPSAPSSGGSGPPPPPPPPPPGGDSGGSASAPSAPKPKAALTLAEQIAQRKKGGLKKASERKVPEEKPVPKSGGGNLMGDLLGALKARRGRGGNQGGNKAPAKKGAVPSAPSTKKFGGNSSAPKKFGGVKKNVGSAPKSSGGKSGGNSGGGDLGPIKQELMDFIKEEIQKAKNEIIEAIQQNK